MALRKQPKPDSSLDSLLKSMRDSSSSEAKKGAKFEKLMRDALPRMPGYGDRFIRVVRYNDWELGDGQDKGIDLVAQISPLYDGGWCAIQCKFYQEGHPINKADMDSFISESGKGFHDENGKTAHFSERLVISTTDNWGPNAESAIQNQNPPVGRIGLARLRDLPMDWSNFKPKLRKTEKSPRGHQTEAKVKVVSAFKSGAERGKLIMACGSGKTYAALQIAENYVGEEHGSVLFLVPSISLLSQSLNDFVADRNLPHKYLVVCSDSSAGNLEEEDDSAADLLVQPTTNPNKIRKHLQNREAASSMLVVFATYHSLDVVAKAQGKSQFDLIICDEAHRTTGVALEKSDETHFVKVHDNKHIKGRRRLYMTATPKIYTTGVRQTAKEHDAAVYSMDDKQHYGEELFRYSFSRAVKQGILADYHVHILCVKKEEIMDLRVKTAQQVDAALLSKIDPIKMAGCWKAIRRPPPNESKKPPMKRVVAFCNRIRDSKYVREAMPVCAREAAVALDIKKERDLVLDVKHVDGTMSAMTRASHLAWLREEPEDGHCRILTNARCLTEGVDVPALDGIVFFEPRRSQIDIVQAVGRVMRIAPGKTVGNIILPVVLPDDATPETLLSRDETYKHVWQVLSALRAHDDRFQAEVNKVQFNRELPDNITVDIGMGGEGGEGGKGEDAHPPAKQLIFGFLLSQWTSAIIPRFVENCGERGYWVKWARDVSRIAEAVIQHIRGHIESDESFRRMFDEFLRGFRASINDLITEEQAIQALAQHIITKPVFDALFQGYAFSEQNTISRGMNKIVAELQKRNIAKETETLGEFYQRVADSASGIKTLEGRQDIMEMLYGEFFQGAFKKDAEQAGIVYTPTEVVDFINQSADWLLRKEFKVAGLAAKNVHILDPFTGTGRFVVRLLASPDLIPKKDLGRKYRKEIHANEKLLLPYYIANVNIEQTYHARTGGGYAPFPHGILCDTFNTAEQGGDDSFAFMKENKERADAQSAEPIRVILSNPPYSIGQRDANDDAQNPPPGFYENLDGNISNSFVAESVAVNHRSMYDSYVRAIRWAIDRIPADEGGIVGFVTNGSFLRSNSADGLRKSLVKELSAIYILDLRGNQRTQGETSLREGGKIFGGGSRTPVAIVLMVKKPGQGNGGRLHYCDIGDSLTREDKLAFLADKKSAKGIKWKKIMPSPEGDWLDKRDPAFNSLLPIGDKQLRNALVANNEEQLTPMVADNGAGDGVIFAMYSNGVVSSRDAWVYNFSASKLASNMRRMIGVYNRELQRYIEAVDALGAAAILNLLAFLTGDNTQISWSRGLRSCIRRGKRGAFNKAAIVPVQYRPFCVKHLYYDRMFNETLMRSNILFGEEHDNRAICVNGTGGFDWSVLAVSRMPDFSVVSGTQCFPFYYWAHGEKRENITDGALEKFRKHYKDKRIGKMDIFHYVYAVLHHPDYRERFKGNLMRELPRIPFAPDFRAFAAVGKKLMNLHINYEDAKEFKLRPVSDPDSPQSELGFSRQAGQQDLRVERMRFGRIGRKTDKSVLRYNASLSFQIPDSAHDYKVNGKSPVEWVVDRYKISEDKDSGIVQNANDWSEERGNSAYILSLLKKAVHIGTESAAQIRTLPKDLGIPK